MEAGCFFTNTPAFTEPLGATAAYYVKNQEHGHVQRGSGWFVQPEADWGTSFAPCARHDMRRRHGLDLNGLSYCYAMKVCYQDEECMTGTRKGRSFMEWLGWVPSNDTVLTESQAGAVGCLHFAAATG